MQGEMTVARTLEVHMEVVREVVGGVSGYTLKVVPTGRGDGLDVRSERKKTFELQTLIPQPSKP